ncbi:porin [Glaciecola sp. MH2013]|uniref:porin n=1 Tax=Glaciecola sp. MH2013 TaxID=2785524 RepID=UPI00189FA9DB|nr:porin [Glaciecola sp. MH2013]MBF7074407.1 porin [Glaciecola sp. MH2013]
MFISSTKTTASLLCALLSLSLGFSKAASAEYSFNGFANLGVTYSDSEQLAYRSSLLNNGREDLSLIPDTLVGLQSNYRFNDKFDAVGQIILQDRDNTSLTNFVELAFVRFQANRNWAFKIGRFSTNSYLFTDYRYVGHLLNRVRPPLEMYSAAGSLGNMDGLHASYTMDVDWGAIKFSGAYGQSSFNDTLNGGEVTVDYTELSSLNIEFQSTEWRFHMAYLTAVMDNFDSPDLDGIRNLDQLVPAIFVPFALELKNNLIPDGKRITYVSVGGQYSFDSFDLIAEYSDYEGEWALAASAKSGYVSLAYPIKRFTPFITAAFYDRQMQPEIIDYANAQAVLPDFAFQQLVAISAGANEAIRGGSIDQNSISVGIKWDFSDAWAVKAQVDHFDIGEFGSGFFSVQEGLLTPAEKLSYNVFSLNFTTTF